MIKYNVTNDYTTSISISTCHKLKSYLLDTPAITFMLIVMCLYLLENEVSISATDTLNCGEGKHDVSLAIDVRVHNTKNVLEVLRDDQRHLRAPEMVAIFV